MPYEMWLAEQIKAHGRTYSGGDKALASDIVGESIREKKFTPRKDFDNRRAAAAAFGIGWELRLHDLAQKRIGVMPRGQGVAAESGDGTDSSVFLASVSSIYTAEMEAGYEQAQSPLRQMIMDYPTPDRLGEIAVNKELMPVDKARDVAQGQPYPKTDVNGYYVTIPKPVKGGLIMQVTLEHMTEGQTADRMDAARRVGEAVAMLETKDILSVVLGVTNPYKRNGTGLNTYLDTGSWANRLDDFNQANGPTEFDRLEKLFDAMVDPITGEVIQTPTTPPDIYVPRSNLVQTGMNIAATQVWNEQNAAAGTFSRTTIAPNPFAGLPAPATDRLARKVLTDSGVTGSIADTYVVYGWLKLAFGYRFVRPFEVLEQDSELATEVGFSQDIVYACKGRKWGCCFVRDPMMVTLGKKTS